MDKIYVKPMVSNYSQAVGLVPAFVGAGLAIGASSAAAATVGAAVVGAAVGAVAAGGALVGKALAGRTNYHVRAESMPALDAVEMSV